MSIRTTTHAAYANANVPQPILTVVSLVTLPVTVPNENETPSKILTSAPYVIDHSCKLEPIPILELTYAFNPTPTDDVELPISLYS